MKAEGRPRRILPLDPFSVADSVGAAQARSGIRAVFRRGRLARAAQAEQDSLQEKGMRKDLDWASPWLHE